jgi:hypothetical protein
MSGEISSRPGSDPATMRASDQDRDRVVEILQTAAGDGRLTAPELDERLEAALTARTYADLVALTTDLPVAGAMPVPALPGDARPKDLVRIDCRSGSVRRDGRWLVPRRIEAKTTSGTILLDFTQAVISQSALAIDADVRSGTLTLITRPGIVVDTEDVSTRSGAVSVKAPWDADTPETLRITISGQVRSGSIVARPPRAPRRTFWQWLRRAPRPKALPYR